MPINYNIIRYMGEAQLKSALDVICEEITNPDDIQQITRIGEDIIYTRHSCEKIGANYNNLTAQDMIKARIYAYTIFQKIKAVKQGNDDSYATPPRTISF